ncbi:UNVERIFIED_ORG: hypothetical protein ABIB63_002952 [Xanthomonas axonopodis]
MHRHSLGADVHARATRPRTWSSSTVSSTGRPA